MVVIPIMIVPSHMNQIDEAPRLILSILKRKDTPTSKGAMTLKHPTRLHIYKKTIEVNKTLLHNVCSFMWALRI
jgi:hypothetical protein